MKNLKAIVVSLMVMTILVFAGCRGGGETNNGESQKSEEEVIKIGATLDFTGPNAVYGEQVKQGIEIAVAEINKKGGVKGRDINVQYQDSKSNPKEAVANAQKYLGVNNIKILIGEISSNATAAMIPVVEQNNAFLFAPASSSSSLTNISENFARNWPSDVAEAGAAANYALSHLHAQNSAIIYVNSDYGIGLKEKFVKVFSQDGGQVLSAEEYQEGETNFKTLLLKIKGIKPECIYLAGNPKEMGRCIKQLRESGITSKVISNTGFLQEDCLKVAGKSADGVIVPTPSYSPSNGTNEMMSSFYKSFKDQYEKEPTMINANAYDAIYLIKEAIEANGGKVDPAQIAQHIRNRKNFHGVAGMVSFTNGDVEVPIIFKTIKDGKPIEL